MDVFGRAVENPWCSAEPPASSPEGPVPSSSVVAMCQWPLTHADLLPGMAIFAAGVAVALLGVGGSRWARRCWAEAHTRRLHRHERRWRDPLWLLPSPPHRSPGFVLQEWTAALIGLPLVAMLGWKPTLLHHGSTSSARAAATGSKEPLEEEKWGNRCINRHRPLVLAPLTWERRHPIEVYLPLLSPGRPSELDASPGRLWCLPRHGFALLYHPDALQSVWCGYHLTKETVTLARHQRRCLSFYTDLSLPRRDRAIPANCTPPKGFERGHLAPHASVCFTEQGGVEAALLTNVMMQRKAVNRGVWRQVESASRAYVRSDFPLPPSTTPVVGNPASQQPGRATAARVTSRSAVERDARMLHDLFLLKNPHISGGTRGDKPSSAAPSSLVQSLLHRLWRQGTSHRLLVGVGPLFIAPNSTVYTALLRRIASDCPGKDASDPCLTSSRIHTTAIEETDRFSTARPRRRQQRWRRRLVVEDATTKSSGEDSPCADKKAGRRSTALPIPDACFMSLWDPDTNYHLHFVVPNDESCFPATKLNGTTVKQKIRRAKGDEGDGYDASDGLAMKHKVLQSLLVSTKDLELLFGESMHELQRRCQPATASTGGTSPASPLSSSCPEEPSPSFPLSVDGDSGSVPPALPLWELFPVYQRRWWIHTCLSRAGAAARRLLCWLRLRYVSLPKSHHSTTAATPRPAAAALASTSAVADEGHSSSLYRHLEQDR